MTLWAIIWKLFRVGATILMHKRFPDYQDSKVFKLSKFGL